MYFGWNHCLQMPMCPVRRCPSRQALYPLYVGMLARPFVTGYTFCAQICVTMTVLHHRSVLEHATDAVSTANYFTKIMDLLENCIMRRLRPPMTPRRHIGLVFKASNYINIFMLCL